MKSGLPPRTGFVPGADVIQYAIVGHFDAATSEPLVTLNGCRVRNPSHPGELIQSFF
jgi:hypothetical protein